MQHHLEGVIIPYEKKLNCRESNLTRYISILKVSFKKKVFLNYEISIHNKNVKNICYKFNLYFLILKIFRDLMHSNSQSILTSTPSSPKKGIYGLKLLV